MKPRSQSGAITLDHRGMDIRISGASKQYENSGRTLQVLSGVDLHIQAGEFVSIVGRSGCGKSTLLKAIAGLESIDDGSILVGETPATAGREDVGIMLQMPALMPWRTVLANVLLPYVIQRGNKSEGLVRADEALELVGLSAFRDAYPWQLSGGMQQRVSLARLLVRHPTVQLMDEPFGALDEFTRERLNLEYSNVVQDQEGTTVVFVTHSIAEAVLMSDRVVVMGAKPGRILGEVLVEIPRPRSPKIINTPEFIAASASIRGMLDSAGGE